MCIDRQFLWFQMKQLEKGTGVSTHQLEDALDNLSSDDKHLTFGEFCEVFDGVRCLALFCLSYCTAASHCASSQTTLQCQAVLPLLLHCSITL